MKHEEKWFKWCKNLSIKGKTISPSKFSTDEQVMKLANECKGTIFMNTAGELVMKSVINKSIIWNFVSFSPKIYMVRADTFPGAQNIYLVRGDCVDDVIFAFQVNGTPARKLGYFRRVTRTDNISEKINELEECSKKASSVVVTREPMNPVEYAQMLSEVNNVTLEPGNVPIIPEGAQFIAAKTPEMITELENRKSENASSRIQEMKEMMLDLRLQVFRGDVTVQNVPIEPMRLGELLQYISKVRARFYYTFPNPKQESHKIADWVNRPEQMLAVIVKYGRVNKISCYLITSDYTEPELCFFGQKNISDRDHMIQTAVEHMSIHDDESFKMQHVASWA